MPQEIERKFLVRDDSYKAMAYKKKRIRQGYICSERGRTVRVRIQNEEGYLTIKGRFRCIGYEPLRMGACSFFAGGGRIDEVVRAGND